MPRTAKRPGKVKQVLTDLEQLLRGFEENEGVDNEEKGTTSDLPVQIKIEEEELDDGELGEWNDDAEIEENGSTSDLPVQIKIEEEELDEVELVEWNDDAEIEEKEYVPMALNTGPHDESDGHHQLKVKIEELKEQGNPLKKRCPKCGYYFYNLKRHSHVHSVDMRRKFDLKIRQQTELERQRLITHLESIKYRFECSVCQKKLRSSKNLRIHMLSHTGDSPHECSVCQRQFTRGIHLREHMLTHTGENPFECTHCDAKFKRSRVLTRHLLTDHRRADQAQKPHIQRTSQVAERKLHKCPLCDREIIARQVKKHELFHKRQAARRVECEFCKEVFNDIDKLRRHTVKHHTGEYQCTICGLRFLRLQMLKTHQRTYHVE